MIKITKQTLENLLAGSTATNQIFKRNLLKEYFQVLVLDFIYSHPTYGRLVFYGGSCLFHCHQLPRLSEDLDFIDLKKKVVPADLANDLQIWLQKTTGIIARTGLQKWRIFLKFPVLRELGLANQSESDLLLLKVEIFKDFTYCRQWALETLPLFKWNRSVLITTFDLPTLMATKIMAIFYRRWQKKDKTGKIIASVKGRDYFDLMWYLERKVKPNLACFDKNETMTTLKTKLLQAVEKADAASIKLDLEALVDNPKFAHRLGTEIKEILKRGIEKL